MTENEQRRAAKEFANRWKGKGYEKGESQRFWLDLLQNVYGVEMPTEYVKFEEQVKIDKTSFIDIMIPSVKVMIEQKSLGKNLGASIKQSDGTMLKPIDQAKRYINELPVDEHPLFVITCNFAEFWIYDMNKPHADPQKIRLEDLEKEYYRMQFLVERGNSRIEKEMEISVAAGDIVKLLYNALRGAYRQPDSEETLKSLNVLCTRLVFCLYAENAGIFGHYGIFHDYMAQFEKEPKRMREALKKLFRVLDTPYEERDPYLQDDDAILAAFPYVNGGLFADEGVEIPPFDARMADLLLNKASAGFDWHGISPTIFGAVFESTLNVKTQREGGMHYTSVENIHKVIDPLFLDDLTKELEEIKKNPVEKEKERQVRAYCEKLASLKFLDPACGSGNFLTETYICLRRLENEALRELSKQITFGDVKNPIQVSIENFYGIEINDFAVSVAKTALWIAESQMMQETADIVNRDLNFLPLKTNAHIVEGNALRMNWEDLVPKSELNYIMGNPPFVGYAWQTVDQKSDMALVAKLAPHIGKNIDYVANWYFKAAQYIQNTDVHVAFVSTNSITQGEQVAGVWKPMYESFGVHIDFAYRTFIWNSEANNKARVHCVIIGFSMSTNIHDKKIFSANRLQLVKNINPYLLDAPTVFIERRAKPICNVPEIYRGSQPTDDGNLVLTENEKNELIMQDPVASKFIRPYMMGKDFIQRKPRYCLWLVGADPSELKKCPHVLQRIERVRNFRASSKKAATRAKANTPTLFDENHECKSDYVAIPKVSSETRRYIPMDYLSQNIIAGDKLFMLPSGSVYNFGVLTSNVHMAWTRAVCGRLKSDYTYSNTIVYNNFPWPTPTEEQKAEIEETAQGILDARALYPDSSLADLYDENTMPPELRTAHQKNDKAVMAAYGFTKDSAAYKEEAACVAELMKLYKALTEKQ